MAFMIRTIDGRTSICTLSAATAAGHVKRLNLLGQAVELFEVTGPTREPGALIEQALFSQQVAALELAI